jgi:hypothetical protein
MHSLQSTSLGLVVKISGLRVISIKFYYFQTCTFNSYKGGRNTDDRYSANTYVLHRWTPPATSGGPDLRFLRKCTRPRLRDYCKRNITSQSRVRHDEPNDIVEGVATLETKTRGRNVATLLINTSNTLRPFEHQVYRLVQPVWRNHQHVTRVIMAPFSCLRTVIAPSSRSLVSGDGRTT